MNQKTQKKNSLGLNSCFLDLDNPFELFKIWMKEAEKKEENDPNALSLATANKNGAPSVRIVLLKDVNDSKEHAEELIQLLKEFNCKINLIPFNEIEGQYMRPDNNRIDEFAKILHDNSSNLRVLIRWSKGEDIDAACGQLATN